MIKPQTPAAAILRTSARRPLTGRLQGRLRACRTAGGPGLLTPHHIMRWATPAFESGSNFKISPVLIPQAWFHLINKLCVRGPIRLPPPGSSPPKPTLQVSADRTLFPLVTEPPPQGFRAAFPRRTRPGRPDLARRNFSLGWNFLPVYLQAFAAGHAPL